VLCEELAGVVGVIAIDGTKIRASASRDQNRSYEGIVAEILDEAERMIVRRTSFMVTLAGMSCRSAFARARAAARHWLRLSSVSMKEAAAERDAPAEPVVDAVELDVERLGLHVEGRRGWFKNARRQLDEQREHNARPVARLRSERLAEAKRRLEEQLAVEVAANAAYEAYRARGVMKDGRRFSKQPTPTRRPPVRRL